MSTEKLISLAKTALEIKNYDEVLGFVNDILKNDIKCAEAWFLKAKVISEKKLLGRVVQRTVDDRAY